MSTSRDEYIAAMKKQLDEWSEHIADLEKKGHKIKEEARVEYEEHLAALHTRRAEGEKKLAEMRAATESSWEQVRLETDNVWEAFKDSYQAFTAHFK